MIRQPEMKRQRQAEKDGLIVTHFGGLHTYDNAKEALEELPLINHNKKQIYEIVINDDDIKLDFSREEEQHLIDKVKSIFGKFERGALAIVTNHDLVFGLSRMLEMTIENEQIVVSLFRTEDSARKWIQEAREMYNAYEDSD